MRTIYFDANVFLAFVSDEADRAAVIEELLSQVQAKALSVLTSTVSIAEVAYGAERRCSRCSMQRWRRASMRCGRRVGRSHS